MIGDNDKNTTKENNVTENDNIFGSLLFWFLVGMAFAFGFCAGLIIVMILAF